MTMGDAILVVIALVVGTLLAIGSGCMINTNIGAGDFNIDKEAPHTEVLTHEGDIR